MRQLDFTDVLESEPTPCSCGKIPKLVVTHSEVYGKLYNYQCECGMWQGRNSNFVAYIYQEEALRDWNKPNRRKFNKWHDWERPEKTGQMSIELDD